MSFSAHLSEVYKHLVDGLVLKKYGHFLFYVLTSFKMKLLHKKKLVKIKGVYEKPQKKPILTC